MPTSRKPLLQKSISLLSYFVLAGIIAFLIADSHPPTLAVGDLAPIDEKIARIDGRSTSFRKMLTKPMVINFWASWCPPCVKELPVMSKVSQRYKDRIIFVGAALNSDMTEIANLKKQFMLNYEMIAINDALADLWQARALPTTYLLDTSGTIIWSHAGVLTEEDLEHAIKAVLTKGA